MHNRIVVNSVTIEELINTLNADLKSFNDLVDQFKNEAGKVSNYWSGEENNTFMEKLNNYNGFLFGISDGTRHYIDNLKNYKENYEYEDDRRSKFSVGGNS